MILVTGHSHKLDGIAFVAATNSVKEALAQLRDAWNERFGDKVKLVSVPGFDYLLSVDYQDDVVADFEDDCPRREGHVLHCTLFEKPGVIMQSMGW